MNSVAESDARSVFFRLIGEVAATIEQKPLDGDLEIFLNTTWPPDSETFRRLAGAIATGAREGWLCQREAEGIRFGRVIKPGGQAGRFSVDVVSMPTCAGPHHIHPQGEIGLIAPTQGAPTFDGKPAGWYVYGPGSAHSPTIRDGAAFVLYLLPGGAIEFTGR